MKTNKEQIYDFLKLHASTKESGGVTTQYLADALGILRTNVSSLLNELVNEGRVSKSDGRPVLYKLKSQEEICEEQCFENLIGSEGSLRRPIQVAKAAIIYPEKSLNSVIVGDPGTGKSFLAMIMHRYATAAKVIPQDAPYIVFDCKDYQGDEESLLAELFGEDERSGIFSRAGKGVLHIDNGQFLSTGLRNKICSALEENQHQDGQPLTHIAPIVILAIDRSNKAAVEDFSHKLPIVIELPALAERPMDERMAMIQSFFTLEAARAKKSFAISAELLRCLLLYECPLNIKQLKGDIKRACAMAYFRERNNQDPALNIFMSDFEPYVRKGFLNYRDHREEIERIIPANYDYTFSESTMKMSAIDRAKLNSTTMYEEIDRRTDALIERGMTEEEISILLSAELETIFRRYWNEVARQVINKEQLANLVDQPIIEIVDAFLTDVSAKLLQSFPPSVFYGLCLHVNSLVKGASSRQVLTNRQMAEIVEKHETKYSLALQFTTKLEESFSIKVPVEEAFLITLFLCFDEANSETNEHPVILIALMGEGVATSLSTAINQTLKQNNTFAFEIPIEYQPATTYHALSEMIKKIDRGRGIIVLYDMEFMNNYLETIALETGIEIRAVSYPITLIGIEWARRAAISDDVNSLYQNMLNNLEAYRKPLERVIVTLCSTGEGGAQELKRYIEQYGNVEEMKIIPLSMADRDQLREKLQTLQKKALIHCIVGTNDPKLFSIPFIPISDVLGAEPAALPEILQFKNREKRRIDFDEVFNYLGEQLEFVDVKKLRKILPAVIEQINNEITHMSIDTEIGLLMHLASSINRILGKEPLPPNIHREQILKDNNTCYKKLLHILKPLEKSFGIIFTDDEMANIITIIKKI
ncbi:MAG: PRD domain-containing protein [Anaerolineaceae bacterium]|nr:PRD domain-containing protein [Anaerolineaceae bacterium]